MKVCSMGGTLPDCSQCKDQTQSQEVVGEHIHRGEKLTSTAVGWIVQHTYLCAMYNYEQWKIQKTYDGKFKYKL